MIDLSLMRTVEVDGERRIAPPQGGATWLDFDAATQALGLVTPGGVVGSTGVCRAHARRRDRPPDRPARADLRPPRRRGGRHAGRRPWSARAPTRTRSCSGGCAAAGGNFGVATRLEFRLHPLERVVGGRLAYAGKGVREALRRFRDVAARSPRDLSCQASLDVGRVARRRRSSSRPATRAPTATRDELRALRSAPGLVDDGAARAHVHRPAARVRPAVRREPPLLEGPLRARAAGRADRRAARRIVALGRRPAADPDRVAARRAEGRRRRRRGAVGFRDAAFNISAMATWQDAGPRRASSIEWARETAAAHRAVVVQRRRLRQLHAGRRADRARPRRVRRRGVRAPPGAQEAIRPGQRPAPQPEHPPAGDGSKSR